MIVGLTGDVSIAKGSDNYAFRVLALPVVYSGETV